MKREKQSGKTEQDLIEDAERLHHNLDEGTPRKPFPFLEAWQVLRYSPKWSGDGSTEGSSAGSKRRISDTQLSEVPTENDIVFPGSDSVVQESDERKKCTGRPVGRKKAKLEEQHARENRELAKAYEKSTGQVAKAMQSKADAIEMKANALREQSMVLAFTRPGAEGRAASKEFFELFEEDALEYMRNKVRGKGRVREVEPKGAVSCPNGEAKGSHVFGESPISLEGAAGDEIGEKFLE